MIVDVILIHAGWDIWMCDYCGCEISKDRPERCPHCGNELDYRDLEIDE